MLMKFLLPLIKIGMHGNGGSFSIDKSFLSGFEFLV